MKKYFLTGLIILLPIAVTTVIVIWILNLITNPFVGLFDQILNRYSWYLNHQAAFHAALKILLLFALFFFTALLGVLGRIYIFKSLLSFYDYLLHRIPVIKSVYKATQQIITAIFGSSAQSFKQVVLVRFPKEGYSIGFITGNAPKLCESTLGSKLVTVFVPTTPNPTSGFLMLYREEEVTYLDMKVEDAFKYIISCGVLTEVETASQKTIQQ